MKNYYESLGVPDTATEAEIKHAYRQLALRLHPDRTPNPAAQALFLEVQEAYDILGDRHRRLAYELLRRRAHELAHQARAVASPYDAQPLPANAPAVTAAVAERRRRQQADAAKLRHYAGRARTFNWLMVVFGLSLALDWALPLRRYPDQLVVRKEVIFVSESRANPRIAYIIRTPNTHFRLSDDVSGLLHEGDRVTVWRSPLWRLVPYVQPGPWPQTYIYLTTIYSVLALWPAMLLLVAAVGLLPRRSDEFRLNTAVVAGLLLPIVAYMLAVS